MIPHVEHSLQNKSNKRKRILAFETAGNNLPVNDTAPDGQSRPPCFDHSAYSLKIITRETFEATPSKRRTKTFKTADGCSWIRSHCLGEGAYGFVYLGLRNDDIETNGLPLKMAIKCSPIVSSSTLIDEENILMSLSSPYVISCYGSKITKAESRSSDSDYNLILEYCAGGSIKDYLNFRRQGMAENDVQLFALDILKGISYLHSSKIIHCDIKPGNILLKPQFTRLMPNGFVPKVGDFGLALRKTSDEYGDGYGHKRGTLFYMSPELLREGILDYAADIWAFGCTVLEIFTGYRPWNEHRLLERKNFEDIIAMSNLKPEVPAWLSDDAKDFLDKCFERDHVKRYDSTALLKHQFLTSIEAEEVQ